MNASHSIPANIHTALSISTIRLGKQYVKGDVPSAIEVLIAGQRFAFPPIPHAFDYEVGEAAYDRLISPEAYFKYLGEEFPHANRGIGEAVRALIHHVRQGHDVIIEGYPVAGKHLSMLVRFVKSVISDVPEYVPPAVAVATGERQSTDLDPAGELIQRNQTRPDLPEDLLFVWRDADGARRWGLCYDLEGDLTMITDTGELESMCFRRMFGDRPIAQYPTRWRFARTWWQLAAAARRGCALIEIPESRFGTPSEFIPDAAFDAMTEGYHRTLKRHAENRERVTVRGLTHPRYDYPERHPGWTFSDSQFRDGALADDPLCYEMETHGMFDRLDEQNFLAAEWLNQQGLDDPDVAPSIFQGANLVALRTEIAGYLKDKWRSVWSDSATTRPARPFGPLTAAAQAWAEANDIRALSEHVKPCRKVRASGAVIELSVTMQKRHPDRWMWRKIATTAARPTVADDLWHLSDVAKTPMQAWLDAHPGTCEADYWQHLMARRRQQQPWLAGYIPAEPAGEIEYTPF